MRSASAAAVVIAVALLAGCTGTAGPVTQTVSEGDARIGKELIDRYGCGTCHVVPGVARANGTVGPPLTDFGERAYIAGALANNQDNLISWIMDPQDVEPGTAMPDLDVTEEEAEHISAYLLGL